jgi:hypothetical protein
MGKRAVLKNIDLYTDADELEKTAPDKKSDKLTPTEKIRRNRQHQKQVVRELIEEFKKLSHHKIELDSEDDFLDDKFEEKKKINRILYTIKPVN